MGNHKEIQPVLTATLVGLQIFLFILGLSLPQTNLDQIWSSIYRPKFSCITLIVVHRAKLDSRVLLTVSTVLVTGS